MIWIHMSCGFLQKQNTKRNYNYNNKKKYEISKRKKENKQANINNSLFSVNASDWAVFFELHYGTSYSAAL